MPNGMLSVPSFKGHSKIFAIADSHQDTRNAAKLLSKILKDSKTVNNALFLHCGDIFEGIYDKNLERDCYIKAKETKPDLEMVFTLGNHDFGYDEKSLGYFMDVVKKFTQKGMQIVSANLFDNKGKRFDGVTPYTIINRDGDKNFVTGFCINEMQSKGLKYVTSVPYETVIDDLKQAIEIEKPDNIIVLNHDFMTGSQKLVDYCKSKGINIDLVIGGHTHEYEAPDEFRHIYYPQTYGEEMYYIDLEHNNGTSKIDTKEIIKSAGVELDDFIRKPIEIFEEENNIFGVISKRVLNLWRSYDNPSPLGSFFADSIKEAANADVGFFSTGFVKKGLDYGKGKNITNYDFLRCMPTSTPIKTVNLNIAELKEIFSHSVKVRGFVEKGNQRLLQCSNNIKLEGLANKDKQCFEIKQIYIDNQPLLDDKGNPLSDRTYKCAIDTYIGNGGQQFPILPNKEKEILYINNEPSKINEVMKQALIQAQYKYPEGSEYPCYEIINLDD